MTIDTINESLLRMDNVKKNKPHVVTISTEIVSISEPLDWCEKNLGIPGYKWYVDYMLHRQFAFYFEEEKYAVWFSILWSGVYEQNNG